MERMNYSLKDFFYGHFYSYLSEFTGFALADFIDWKEIVKIEMIRAMMADNKKTSHPIRALNSLGLTQKHFIRHMALEARFKRIILSSLRLSLNINPFFLNKLFSVW
jgi:hypothetical protein